MWENQGNPQFSLTANISAPFKGGGFNRGGNGGGGGKGGVFKKFGLAALLATGVTYGANKLFNTDMTDGECLDQVIELVNEYKSFNFEIEGE